MLHPLEGHDETELQATTSIAGRGYRLDSHLFLTLPAVLMIVSIAASVWRSSGGILATLVLLNGICALAAILGLQRVWKSLRRLKLGSDVPYPTTPDWPPVSATRTPLETP